MLSRNCLGVLGAGTFMGGVVGVAWGVTSLISNGASDLAGISLGLGAASWVTTIFIGVIHSRRPELEEIELREPFRHRVRREGEPRRSAEPEVEIQIEGAPS
jgi:hypothetical protein